MKLAELVRADRVGWSIPRTPDSAGFAAAMLDTFSGRPYFPGDLVLSRSGQIAYLPLVKHGPRTIQFSIDDAKNPRLLEPLKWHQLQFEINGTPYRARFSGAIYAPIPEGPHHTKHYRPDEGYVPKDKGTSAAESVDLWIRVLSRAISPEALPPWVQTSKTARELSESLLIGKKTKTHRDLLPELESRLALDPDAPVFGVHLKGTKLQMKSALITFGSTQIFLLVDPAKAISDKVDRSFLAIAYGEVVALYESKTFAYSYCLDIKVNTSEGTQLIEIVSLDQKEREQIVQLIRRHQASTSHPSNPEVGRYKVRLECDHVVALRGSEVALIHVRARCPHCGPGSDPRKVSIVLGLAKSR